MDRSDPGRLAAPLVSLALAALSPAFAQRAAAGDASEVDFYRAYYLEREAGDLHGALQLYRSAAADRSLPDDLRQRASRFARGCEEELAATDLAALAPADTILYVELQRPGERIGDLLDQLGLLQHEGHAGALGISPALLQGTLGLRGAALAVTRVDPTGGPPGGVLVLHPGDMLAVRGLIETALPAGGQAVEPLGGFPTYSIEGQAFVTVTERTIVAGTERALIQGVLDKLAGHRGESLADVTELAPTMALRGEDLAFFCVQVEPLLPLVHGLVSASLQHGGGPPPALLALLDIDSTRALAGRIGVGESGLGLDLALQLDEDHHNVVFNLLRMPHVGESALRLIPSGAALFAATSLNASGGTGTGVTDERGRPVVTVMDLGREVFGNIADVAVFALPSFVEGPYGMRLPDAALAMNVNDSDRSAALWQLVFGLAKGASGGDSVAPRHERLAGVDVLRYDVQGVPVYLYAGDGRVVVSPSPRALEASLAASRGESLLTDPLFSQVVEGADGRTALLGFSIGRAAHMASGMAPHGELPPPVRELLPLLKDAVVAAHVRHSDTQLALSARLAGLPNVAPIVERFVREQRGGGPSVASANLVPETRAVSRETFRPADVRQVASVRADDTQSLRERLETLAASGERDAVCELVPVLAKSLGDDAMALNDLAWQLVGEEPFGPSYADAALPLALKADAVTHHENWYVVDTLAHVRFALGEVERAIELQERAVALAQEARDRRASEAVRALERFRSRVVQDGR